MDTNTAIIAMTAIVLGSLTVLIPIAGITARIALKPLMESMARYREMQGNNQAQQLLERRMALVEEQLHSMERTMGDLSEAADFHRQLQSPARPALSVPGPRVADTPVTAGYPEEAKP